MIFPIPFAWPLSIKAIALLQESKRNKLKIVLTHRTTAANAAQPVIAQQGAYYRGTQMRTAHKHTKAIKKLAAFSC